MKAILTLVAAALTAAALSSAVVPAAHAAGDNQNRKALVERMTKKLSQKMQKVQQRVQARRNAAARKHAERVAKAQRTLNRKMKMVDGELQASETAWAEYGRDVHAAGVDLEQDNAEIDVFETDESAKAIAEVEAEEN